MKGFIHSNKRYFVGAGIIIILVIGALFLRRYGSGVPCMFYKFTGLYCPGCGSGRALTAICRFDIVSAFDYNPLLVILLPFVSYYLLKLFIKYVFQRDIISFFNIPKWVAVALLIVIIAFWILRNIPYYPFDILAP